VLLELEPAIDPRVNARAIAIAASVRELRLAGVRDVVPTFRSVAVHLDPLVADIDAVRLALVRACDVAPTAVAGRSLEVPVVYGGEEGPDLDDVAASAGMSVDEVIQCHMGRTYTVFMLGFLPGFAYMASVDGRIAVPRRPAPRGRVAAGSVGIAGAQTGVYPRDSPGGWQIIGRTPLAVFDPAQSPAALFAPGDTVRFVAVSNMGAAFRRPEGGMGRLKAAPTTAEGVARYVTVVSPGLFTTIQDRGRWGHQANGVPVAGPMDIDSHDAANAAVGNPSDAATLEVTLTGPELRFDHDAVIAVAGADIGASVDGAALPRHACCPVRPGSILRFGERRTGARAYVAFGGGIDIPIVLGSRATHVLSGLGGLGGRALVAGDRFPLGPTGGEAEADHGRLSRLGSEARPSVPAGGARLRVLPGPQDDRLPAAALEELVRSRFRVSPQSNRMGYRLEGARIPTAESAEMISDATFTGSIQVPPSGEPILLMADRQTTGGYPQIATVITADLPLAGQLAPGDWVEFTMCTRHEAVAALARQRGLDVDR
jgi:KipI family sensor histidine kinase inhibitor